MKLGVNIDHVATLRQARHTRYPDPVQAGLIAEQAGADIITLHLREDRRHIQECDVIRLAEMLTVRMNLEMAPTEEMVAFAVTQRPSDCCLVPERRAELTTEGGLNVAGDARMRAVCARLTDAGIRVSLFIDPETRQIEAAAESGVPAIELHTGPFANASGAEGEAQWARLAQAARLAQELGLSVNAGHGLHYHNVGRIIEIPGLAELNIGHAIVAQAVFVGLSQAVKDMKRLINGVCL